VESAHLDNELKQRQELLEKIEAETRTATKVWSTFVQEINHFDLYRSERKPRKSTKKPVGN